MAKAPKNAISPTREENFPEWYQQVIKGADMAETSETRGCMVIKPWGYALWEGVKEYLDKRFKETGHENAYFPLLIPLAYLEKEAEHAEGFATECAVVTHHRLEAQKDEETGKTNVMRWEMRTRLFLRTAEFLWQEGHTAHVTQEEAIAETKMIHSLYEEFARDVLAIPVIPGEKTEAERFPGADNTYTIEAMVQDKKAIQAGTSHYLGQNFSKAQDISFIDKNNKQAFAHTTSWGVSTRLIGTLIMAHSDDDGLVLPPRIAPKQIVIVPVTPKEDSKDAIIDACNALAETLRKISFGGQPVRVHVDSRDLQGGAKKWEWVKKGVPLRIEIGPRDLEARKVCVSRRDEAANEKSFMGREDLINEAGNLLQEVQDSLLAKATMLRDENITEVHDLAAFEKHWDVAEDAQPGWILCPWKGSVEEEEELSKKHKISIRCIPQAMQKGASTCVLTGQNTSQWVLWARSY